MNRMLRHLGYKFYVTDVSTSNLCMVVGLGRLYSDDYNSAYRKFLWEKQILKSVWGLKVGMFY